MYIQVEHATKKFGMGEAAIYALSDACVIGRTKAFNLAGYDEDNVFPERKILSGRPEDEILLVRDFGGYRDKYESLLSTTAVVYKLLQFAGRKLQKVNMVESLKEERE